MQPENRPQPLTTPGFDFLSESSLKVYRADRHLNIRISRNTLLAILLSLLLHALVFFAVPQIKFDTPPSALPARAIEVSLAPPRLPAKVIEPVAEMPPPAPEPVPEFKKPQPQSERPKIMAQKPQAEQKPKFVVPEPTEPNIKKELDKQIPKEQPVKELPVEQQYTDMASYVKAMQVKRQNADTVAAQINAEAAARERGPTEAQQRDERIKRNLKYGTNGIFEITSLGQGKATFAFRGWTNDYSASQRRFYEVEATGGQDVRLVMIRRMIALIREHYDGNFNWESHRLGRSVVLSARPEDSAGLEDFLMMEFFGTNYRTTQY